MKILILKPSSLGDVVHAIPVLRMLKRQLPGSEIYWWIDESLAPLLAGDPDISGLFLFHRKRWAEPRHWPDLWRKLAAMRAHAFDIAIDLQGLARSGAFAWLARAGLTIGLEGARESSAAAYDFIAPAPRSSRHAVDRYLQVLPLLGLEIKWDFEWLPARPDIAQNIRERHGMGAGEWWIFQPGARWANKRWPLEHFSALAGRILAASTGTKIAILGGRDDAPLGAAIAAANSGGCLDLTGRLSLPEMVECIRLSRGMITNDTGPMHVAAALDKEVLALFGPTDPARTGPYTRRGRVLQATDLSCVPCLSSRCHYPKPIEC
ncbi:MAG TPA: glycosyltransferase family 9 protein, partial [Verrucomicrobiae bacterium]|nr:glycosyltransferase family 9 protein [Verrucomicrobiae bacterium]